MRIGLTFDLREEYRRAGFDEEAAAEFDEVETIDAIAQALLAHGHAPDRVGNVRALVGRLARGDRWDLVFNLAEGVHGCARESQVPALLDAYRIPYTFSDPVVLGLALNKELAKRVARDLGIATADFLRIDSLADLGARPVRMRYPLFAKPLAEGSSKGITGACKVATPEVLRAACETLLARYRQPVLVEEFLPGREFTVGLLGTGERAVALGAREVLLQVGADRDIYSWANKQEAARDDYVLATDAQARQAMDLALTVWRGLGCRDAGRVDVRLDAGGVPRFIEVNPLAGLRPVYSDLAIIARLAGLSYEDLVGRIVESACLRLRQDGGEPAPDPS